MNEHYQRALDLLRAALDAGREADGLDQETITMAAEEVILGDNLGRVFTLDGERATYADLHRVSEPGVVDTLRRMEVGEVRFLGRGGTVRRIE